MANLTWRDVAAPDFSGALNGLKVFNDLLSTGLGQAGATVRGLDEAKSNAVNQQFALKLAQEQDPAALQAKIASGELLAGVPTQRLNSASIAALSARPGDLIKQASDRANLETTNMNMAQRKAMDANAGVWNTALGMVNSGKSQSEIEAYLGQHPDAFQGIGYNNLKTVHEDISSGRDKFLNNDQSAFNLANSKEDRANEAIVADAFSKIRAGALTTENARTMLYDPKGPAAGLSPRARASLEARISNEYPGLFGLSGTGAASAISAAAGGGTGGPAALGLTYGGGALPDNIKTVGDLVQNKGNLVRTLGASPVGVYQINADTWADFGPKVLGSNWQSANIRDFNVQDAVGKKIFESTGGDVGKLKARWASLSDADARAISKMPWEQARNVIAKGESGVTDVASLGLENASAQTRLATRNMQDNKNGIAADFLSTVSADSSPVQIADALRGGTFKGTARGYLVNEINRIMREGSVNAATAGAILSRNIQGGDHPFLKVKDFIGRFKDPSPNLGGGIRLDAAGITADIKEAKSGRLLDRIDANRQNSVDLSQLQIAQQQLTAAQAEYQAVVQRLPSQPGLRDTALPQAAAKVQAAALAVQRINQQAAISQRMNPQVASK